MGSSCLYPPQTPSSSLTLYFWVHFEFGPTELFVLAGFVSFDHLPMHLKVEKKSFRSYREGRVASSGWSLLLAELPVALTYLILQRHSCLVWGRSMIIWSTFCCWIGGWEMPVWIAFFYWMWGCKAPWCFFCFSGPRFPNWLVAFFPVLIVFFWLSLSVIPMVYTCA